MKGHYWINIFTSSYWQPTYSPRNIRIEEFGLWRDLIICLDFDPTTPHHFSLLPNNSTKQILMLIILYPCYFRSYTYSIVHNKVKNMTKQNCLSLQIWSMKRVYGILIIDRVWWVICHLKMYLHHYFKSSSEPNSLIIVRSEQRILGWKPPTLIQWCLNSHRKVHHYWVWQNYLSQINHLIYCFK